MKRPEFFMLDAAIAERPDVLASDKIVLAIVRNHIRGNGYGWPGLRTLAKESGLDRGTVLRAIPRLESAGLLCVDRRGVGRANHYRLPPETGRKLQPAANCNRLDSDTAGGCKMQTEAAANCNPNRENTLKRTKGAAAPPPLPSVLDTPDFRKLWEDWKRHLKEIRHALKPTTAGRQLKMLKKHGLAMATAMVEQSITMGWRGLFPPKEQPPNPAEPERSEEVKQWFRDNPDA